MNPDPTSLEPEAVPVPEACRLLGVKRSKLYELLADGSLPSLKIGKKRLIRVAALRDLVSRLEWRAIGPTA